MCSKLVKQIEWQPTFIVGCPRSGTTLLSAILNRHPKICVPPETHFYRYMYEQFPGGLSWVKTNWSINAYQFLEPLTRDYWTDYTPNELIDDLLSPPNNEGEFFLHLISKYQKRANKQFWIEKTPDHLRFIAKILAQHPNARFIYIYRDGRDVALSLCKTGWPWITNDFLDNMLLWNKYIKEETFLTKAYNYHRIKYEDLISNPDFIINKLCSFLDVEYYEDMLIPNGSEKHLAERQSLHKQKIFNNIDPTNCEKWKTEVNSTITRLATTLFKKSLLSYGYDTNLRQITDKKILSCHRSLFFDYHENNYSNFANTSIVNQLEKLGWVIEAFTWQDFPDSISKNSVIVIPDYQISNSLKSLAWLIKNIVLLKTSRNCQIILLQTGNFQVSKSILLLADKKIPFKLSWRKEKIKGPETVLDLLRSI